MPAMFGHHGHSNDFRPHHGGWDTYGGPQALIEPGFRGFLISTLPGKEEFAVDDTILLLRQAAIKMYGAVKITSKKLASNPRYLAIDFMDPANIKLWPTPEEEQDEEEEKDKEKSTNAEGADAEQATEKEAPEVKENENKGAEEATENPTETEEPKEENTSSNTAEGETESSEKKDENNLGKDGSSDKDKKSGETGGEKPAPPPPKRKQYPIMRSIYKFKAFRTESRNVMFIQSNIPDPIALAEASMELLLERKRVYEDGACQLLPVLGVCPFDLEQLEVMSQEVLSPMFSLTEEPKTFSVMVLENLPGPSTENVLEIVRNTIWSINPFACHVSPLTEPDVLVQMDLVGSKLVLCCISKYMHYRYYSPNLLIKQGRGEPEEDDGTWLTPEERKQQEQIRLEREKQKEFERQRQEDFRKERERRKIQFEERRRLQIEERKKAKSKAAESKAAESKSSESKESKSSESKESKASENKESRKHGHHTSEKHEGSSKKVNETPEESKESSIPPSKKQKMEASEENQNSAAPVEEAEKTESQPTEPEEGAPDEDSQPAPAPEEELNTEAKDQEEMDTSTSEAKEKGRQTRNRGRGPRGGRSRSKK